MSPSRGSSWKPIAAIAIIALAALVVFGHHGGGSEQVEVAKPSRISAASIERVK